MSNSLKRVSITDIAKRLQVSPSTVSRALNKHPSISETKRLLVEQAARDLNYQPNYLAAALRKGRSKTIGIIIPYVNGHYYSSILHGVELIATKRGFNVVVCQSNEDTMREQQHIAALLATQVEGMLVCPSAPTIDLGPFRQVQDQNIPLVFFDRTPDLAGSLTVLADDFMGAYTAVEHLIAQGCQVIAHLAGPSYISSTRNRFLGYQAALRTHGIPYRKELVYPLAADTVAAGCTGMHQLLQGTVLPDAVLVAYAYPAAGALEAIKKRGLQVPHDVAVVCFNNEPFTTMLEPALSVVEQNPKQIGETAVQLLLQVIQRSPSILPLQIVLQQKLLERISSKRKSTPQPISVGR